MVAEVVIKSSVELVAAGAGHNVYRSKRRDPGGEIEVHTGQLELLNHLLREGCSRASFHGVANVASIHSDRRTRGRTSQDGDVKLSVELGGVCRIDEHTRF